LPGQINKYLANQCRRILLSWGAENIARAADFRLKKGLRSAINQRDDGELHERCAASTEFIYLVLYNGKLFISICETGDFEKEFLCWTSQEYFSPAATGPGLDQNSLLVSFLTYYALESKMLS